MAAAGGTVEVLDGDHDHQLIVAATTSQSDYRCLDSGQRPGRRYTLRRDRPVLFTTDDGASRGVRRNRLGVDPHRRRDLGIVVPLDCHRAGLTRAIDGRVRPPAPRRSCARVVPAARRPLPRDVANRRDRRSCRQRRSGHAVRCGRRTRGVVGCRDAQRSDATHGPAGRHCDDPPTPGPHPDRRDSSLVSPGWSRWQHRT